MGNRISGFTVILEKDISEEMMDAIEQSFGLLKGVVRIERVIDGTDKYIGQMQENSKIKNALIDFIRSDFGDKK